MYYQGKYGATILLSFHEFEKDRWALLSMYDVSDLNDRIGFVGSDGKRIVDYATSEEKLMALPCLGHY